VRWIVVDRRTVTSEHLGIVERLVDDGEFQVRFNQTDMLVLQRVRPPSGSEGAAGRLAPS
jgi:hypothetical protein